MIGLPPGDDAAALEAASGEQGTPERPGWLPERFKDETDLVRSWEEGQRTLTQAQQRAAAAEQASAELARRLDALEAQQQQTQQGGYDPATDPLIQAEVRALEDGDYAEVARLRDVRTAQIFQAALQMQQQQQQAGDPVQDQTALLAVEQAIARTLGDDLALVRDDVEDILTKRPHMMRDYRTDPAGAVDDYVQVAQWVKREKELAEQSAQLRTQQEQDLAKRRAQTAPGASGRQPGATDARSDLIARMKEIQAQNSPLIG